MLLDGMKLGACVLLDDVKSEEDYLLDVLMHSQMIQSLDDELLGMSMSYQMTLTFRKYP